MIFQKTSLKDAWLLLPERHKDDRGYFVRTMCVDDFAKHGMVTDYPQQNASFTRKAGSLRGLHFQRPPHSEAKLVRCVRGAILDVILDLRSDSPTYMKFDSFRLDDQNGHQLYVPPGFAHSFQTLVDDVEVTYMVSASHAPGAEGGLRYDDPEIGIEWPLPVSVISDKDRAWPLIDSDALPAL